MQTTGETLNTVLDILAATVLLDQKERDQELVEFCHFAQKLGRRIEPDTILSEKSLREWFAWRREDLAQTLSQDDDGTYQREILARITDPDLQKQLIAAVFAIAICDYDFHAAEMTFIRTAMECWKADLPEQAAYDLETS